MKTGFDLSINALEIAEEAARLRVFGRSTRACPFSAAEFIELTRVMREGSSKPLSLMSRSPGCISVSPLITDLTLKLFVATLEMTR